MSMDWQYHKISFGHSAEVMDMALNCYCCAILLAQNLVDRLTIVTSSVEEYLPTVKDPFDKVRMQYIHVKDGKR